MMPPCGGMLGASNWEKNPRQSQNMLEGLYIPSGLGMSQDGSMDGVNALLISLPACTRQHLQKTTPQSEVFLQ